MKYNLPTNVTIRKEDIQSRMQRFRLVRNLSYQDLADMTGISKTTIFKIETDCSDIVPLVYILSVADALRIDPSYLIGLTDKVGETK